MVAEAHMSLGRRQDVQPQVRKRGRPPKIKPTRTLVVSRRLLCERLSAASAAAWFGVSGRQLRQATRGQARIAHARQAAIYFAHVVFCATLTRAGGIFGRDRTTARHACSCIEDRRDDWRFDRACGALEPAMRSWMATFSPDSADSVTGGEA